MRTKPYKAGDLKCDTCQGLIEGHVSDSGVYWDREDDGRVTRLQIQHKKCHTGNWWVPPSPEIPKGVRSSNSWHELHMFATPQQALYMVADMCVSDDWDESQLKRLVMMAQSVQAIASPEEQKRGTLSFESLSSLG